MHKNIGTWYTFFSHFSQRRRFFTSCLLLSCTSMPFWEEVYSNRKEFAPGGSKFFPFRVDLYRRETKHFWQRNLLYPFPLIFFPFSTSAYSGLNFMKWRSPSESDRNRKCQTFEEPAPSTECRRKLEDKKLNRVVDILCVLLGKLHIWRFTNTFETL